MAQLDLWGGGLTWRQVPAEQRRAVVELRALFRNARLLGEGHPAPEEVRAAVLRCAEAGVPPAAVERELTAQGRRP